MFRSETITSQGIPVPAKAGRPQILRKIMTEIYPKVKEFMSETIGHNKELDFGQIEEKVLDLSNQFSQLVANEALKAIGTGYVGRSIKCECGDVLEYHSNRSWKLKSLNGELEIYRAYYYCEKCKSSKVPLDAQLCFEGKHQSIGVRRRMALGGMTQPFEEAEKVLEETGVSVSSKEIQLESEEVGQEVYRQVETEVESFWSGEKEIKAERTPIRLYITADGTTVRTEAGHKEAKLGSVYETPVAQGEMIYNTQEVFQKLKILADQKDGSMILPITFTCTPALRTMQESYIQSQRRLGLKLVGFTIRGS
jgi:hypothetical protein